MGFLVAGATVGATAGDVAAAEAAATGATVVGLALAAGLTDEADAGPFCQLSSSSLRASGKESLFLSFSLDLKGHQLRPFLRVLATDSREKKGREKR